MISLVDTLDRYAASFFKLYGYRLGDAHRKRSFAAVY